MARRVSLFTVTVEAGDGRVTIRGEVWLGPIEVGDCFVSAATATHEDPVNVRLEEMTAPPDAQEPGRVPRVLAVLAGEGIEHVRPGVVLLGEVDRD